MSKGRIVFIELTDEKLDIIIKALIDVNISGYEIHKFKSGKDTLNKILEIKPTLIILGLNENKAKGLSLIKNINHESPTSKIVIFDEINHQPTLIKCLEYGADDYFTFTTQRQTIGYKLKNILKRDKILDDDQLILGNICFNLEENIIYIQDKISYLSKTESSLLRHLMKKANKVVSRTEILDVVWPKPEVYPNIIDVYIEKIRKIVDKPFNTSHIRTIHGKGYMFCTEEIVSLQEDKRDEAI